MTAQPSDIQITYDGTDITQYVIYETARFECQANALPGTFSFTVRDTARSLSFVTGKEVYLYIDGVKFFGGIVLRVGRTYAFPAVDTTDLSKVDTRQWVIEGSDFNIWFDKRVIRNPADYLKAIITPGAHTDQQMIVNYMPNYIDVPPGVNISTTYVKQVVQDPATYFGQESVQKTGVVEYAWVTQGSWWRKQMDEFAARTAAVYYLDADKRLRFFSVEDAFKPWAFVDRGANGTNRVACREITATEDASVLITDTLEWGGFDLTTQLPLVFSRYPFSPSGGDPIDAAALANLAQYGRWQHGEQRFEEDNDQASLDLRARSVIMGPPGSDSLGEVSGARFPLWRIHLTWYNHNLPRSGGTVDHIVPGQVATINLYVMGAGLANPLVQFLPLRQVNVTFPEKPEVAGKAWVKFDGEFALSYGDSRYLWYALLKREGAFLPITPGNVTTTSTSATAGDFGNLPFTPLPDGVNKIFTLGTPVLASSLYVYDNGLYYRQGVEYALTNASTGTITFTEAPKVNDQLWAVMRTGTGPVVV